VFDIIYLNLTPYIYIIPYIYMLGHKASLGGGGGGGIDIPSEETLKG
jgi:hypothetical protein